jgi:hypothetical protein
MVLPVVVELRLGPVVSKVIISDFFEGDTGTVGLEDEVEPAGIENPMTEDVGRVLRDAGPEDGDAGDEDEEEVGGRRRSAHDFLTVAGASGTWDTAGVEGAGVEGAGVEGAGVEGAGVEGAGVEEAGVEEAGVEGVEEKELVWIGSTTLEEVTEEEDSTSSLG